MLTNKLIAKSIIFHQKYPLSVFQHNHHYDVIQMGAHNTEEKLFSGNVNQKKYNIG